MTKEEWNKLSFMIKSYELRIWLFNQIADNQITPLTGMHLDQYILETINICKSNHQETLLTNIAVSCGFLH